MARSLRVFGAIRWCWVAMVAAPQPWYDWGRSGRVHHGAGGWLPLPPTDHRRHAVEAQEGAIPSFPLLFEQIPPS